MNKQFQLFFSNRVELLYLRLKDALFANSTPFTRRLIIVPCPAMKSWLMLQLARDPDIGIAAALEIAYIDQAIMRLGQWIKSESPQGIKSAPQLTHLELALALEMEIRQLINRIPKFTVKENALWQPLLHYLKLSDAQSPIISKKIERRLTTLCDKLATLFGQYALYGGKMVTQWEAEEPTEWQQQLWCTLFRQPLTPEHPASWNYLHRELTTLKELSIQPLQDSDIQIHLFANNFLPNLQHTFLAHLASIAPVNYYLLSPCQAFWSDIHSDRESLWLQAYWKKRNVSHAQQQDLEGYLQDRNPLLANFGKLGREMARQMEESEIQTVEDYTLAGGVVEHAQYEELVSDLVEIDAYETPLTLLQAIQTDLTLLRTPHSDDKVVIQESDASLQVHVACSPMREVQILYDQLVGLIAHTPHAKPISPGEIIVMSPNINRYTPYIKAVFGSSESVLSAQIMDLSIAARSSFIQGFLHLISLPYSRWDATTLLQLFDFPAFQKCQQLNREDVHSIREWTRTGGVRWGGDPSHRNELLKRDHCSLEMTENSPLGTWEHAIDRLLTGLMMSRPPEACEESTQSLSPLEHVETTQSQLLGQWISLIRSLRSDLTCLVNGTTLSLREWSERLISLSERYFSPDDTRAEEDQLILHTHLNTFKQINGKLGTQKLPFSTVRHHLDVLLERQAESYREHDLNAVRFCSMLPMRAIPAQVIALMGMDEGAFPRQDSQLSLNLLQGHADADYHPSQTDFDRYLFLETLLSARQHLLIFYQGYSAVDSKEQPPSLLVTELLSYLDKSYTICDRMPSTHCMRKHPIHSFDSAYFSSDQNKVSNFQSYSQTQYAAAQAYYHVEKTATLSFIPEFRTAQEKSIQPIVEMEQVINVQLKELSACARNPIQTYFNRTLGIYLDKPENRLFKNEEDFHLSPLQHYAIKKDGLKKNVEQVVTRAEREGLFPIGAFKRIAVDRVKKDIGLLQHNLFSLGVRKEGVFTITLSEQCKAPLQSEDGNWTVPSLLINCSGKKTQIIGSIADVSARGLISQHKDDRANIIKIWPQYLILNCLIKEYSLPIDNNVLLINCAKGKIKEPFFADPHLLLSHYLEYYFTALQQVSPLIPEWIPHFMQDVESFDIKMRDSLTNPFTPLYNDYLHWAIQRGDLPDSETLVQRWQPQAQQLFGELYQHWFQ